MQKSKEMQRVIKGKKEAYALLSAKPSGTCQKKVRQLGTEYPDLEKSRYFPRHFKE